MGANVLTHLLGNLGSGDHGFQFDAACVISPPMRGQQACQGLNKSLKGFYTAGIGNRLKQFVHENEEILNGPVKEKTGKSIKEIWEGRSWWSNDVPYYDENLTC